MKNEESLKCIQKNVKIKYKCILKALCNNV